MESTSRARSSMRRGGRARAQGRRHARRGLPGRVRDRDEEPRHPRAARPDRRGRAVAGEGAARSTRSRAPTTAAFVFKTIADPFAGRINLFRVLQGAVAADQTLVDARTHAKERMGSLLFQQGKEHTPAEQFGPGDIGAVAKLKEVQTGDLLLDPSRDRRARDRLPGAGDELRRHAEGEGRRGEGRERAPAAARGGPDAPAPPRPADRRAAPLRDEPDARRGRGRARSSGASTSTSSCTSRACRTSRRSAPSRARTAATRSRRAAAASSATATS